MLKVTGQRKAVVSVLAATTLWACAPAAPPAHTHEVEPTSGATCPPSSTLTYANFGQAFFAAYCVSCHASTVTGGNRNGAPSDHNFDSLPQIQEAHGHIDAYAAAGPLKTNTQMPPQGYAAPTLAERQKLGEWLACDAP